MTARISDCIAQVAFEFGVSADEICGRRRVTRIMRARYAAYYIAKEVTGRSYPDIGRLIGGRDHSTVIHGRDRCIATMEREHDYKRKVQRAMYRAVKMGAFNAPKPKQLEIPKVTLPPKSPQEVYERALEADDFDEVDALSQAAAAYLAQPLSERLAA